MTGVRSQRPLPWRRIEISRAQDMLNVSNHGPVPARSLMNRFANMVRSALVWDLLSYFGSKVVPGFMGLISVPVFIRLIGLDQYGRFAVAVAILMAVGGASSGWLAQGILRFHPVRGDSQGREVIFNRAVNAGTLGTVLITSAVLVLILAGLHTPLLTSLAALAFCFSFVVYTVTLAKFQARLQPVVVLRREIIRSVGSFVFPVALVLMTGRRQFELVLLGQAIAYAIAFLPSSRWLGHPRLGYPVLDHPKEQAAAVLRQLGAGTSSTRETVRQLWRFGWAVGLWLLLSQGLPVIDRWTIQKFAGYSSAGIYASLYEVAIRSFSFLVFPLTQAAHPRIMHAWNEGEFAASYRIIRYSVQTQLIIFMVALTGVVLAAHRVTRLILGFDDPVATRILPILFVGGFLWQLALLVHKPLEIEQRTGAMLAAMSIVVALNIAACFQFIPRYGYPAAAYILALSACCYIAFTLCLTRFGAFRRFSAAAEAQ
jgi:O-antigen/teichoic acid export membrane protein